MGRLIGKSRWTQCNQKEPYKGRQEGHSQRDTIMGGQLEVRHFEGGRTGQKARTAHCL